MKLSLCWIFDHINGSWRDIPIQELISTFNKKTAEIEHVHHFEIAPDLLTVGKVVHTKNDLVELFLPEHKITLTLPARKDAIPDGIYLLKKESTQYRWALLSDLNGSKEGLFPQLAIPEKERAGGWKKNSEMEDYIITIDNTSVTHRPDLWGHRGFAREIAALFNLTLKPEEDFLAAKAIKLYEAVAPALDNTGFSLEINAPQACDRLAGLYMHDVVARPSSFAMASRLARIDSRPIDFFVDCTNYVMFDLSQPLHAFDAQKINTKTIKATYAKAGQKILLLDGETIQLTPEDLIISDGNQPLALAGVMGGLDSGVNRNTSEIYIEAAHFDASTIRSQSLRHKKRTEASTRFEKGLDPNQNTQALLRFLKLCDAEQIPYTASQYITSIGPLAQEGKISISHDFIVKRLGLSISPEVVEKIVVSLGFGLHTEQKDKEIIYNILIPTFRSAKDISIPEDIVEEIGRFVGYEKIPLRLPIRSMEPRSLRETMLTRNIKQQLAFGLCMHEVQNYAFYHEDFLEQIGYNPSSSISLKNPVSQREKRLVTSLVPHLLKNITQNIPEYETLRFFECNKIWKQSSQYAHSWETRSIAGVFFSRKEQIEFYEIKALLQQFFNSLSLPISWVKPINNLDPWYSTHEAAELWLEDKKIGAAGMLNPTMLEKISEGSAFVFEVAADPIYAYIPPQKRFSPLQKYQSTTLDISVLLDQAISVAHIEKVLRESDKRIRSVNLIDFYHKESWGAQRSLTLRCSIFDEHKTLIKEEIDEISANINRSLQALGGTVR